MIEIHLTKTLPSLQVITVSLCNPMDCTSVHGILQARILEWVAIPFSKGFSWHPDPGIEPGSPTLQADSLPPEWSFRDKYIKKPWWRIWKRNQILNTLDCKLGQPYLPLDAFVSDSHLNQFEGQSVCLFQLFTLATQLISYNVTWLFLWVLSIG